MRTPFLAPWLWSIVALTLALIAWIDVRERRIPNLVVLPLLVAGLAHAAWAGGLWGLCASLIGVAAGLALLGFQFARGWMGAGDVKLLGAIGAWGGAWIAAEVWLVGSLLGGLLALIALVRLGRQERREVGQNLLTFTRTAGLAVPAPAAISRRRGIPFGVALATAGALVLLQGASP